MPTPEIAWRAIAPILALAGGGVATLMLVAVSRRIHKGVLVGVCLASLGAAAWFNFDLNERQTVGMQGAVAADGVAIFGSMILIGAAALAILFAYEYLSARGIHRPEFYPLLMFATAGMVLLASANDLLMVFLAVEVLSLALYVMTALARRDDKSQEGALKYFLLGAFASAFLLYGIALAYGATATTNIARISETISAAPPRLSFLAFAFIAAGLGFKMAAVPFHMWTPDVYEGAPTPVTAFMAAGTKTAALIALLRVFLVGFGPLEWDWQPLLWVIAVASMALGSVVAIVQTDVKRMLAYSSIAHAGYLLVGVVAASRDGTSSTLFYMAVYAIATMGAFGVVLATAVRGRERLEMNAWQGIGRRSPAFAGAMTLFLLSLAGIPPTAGFMGKFFIFQAAVESGEVALVVAGLLTSVVAAFFYLRLIVLMWMQEPDAAEHGVRPTPVLTAGLAVGAAATIAFGVWPQELLDLARGASVFLGSVMP
ncbi:MAG TPA: NADH-quinone oxidoreductase subunit NuoN [Actinomycetota bacterium]|nr:NADH-quinone oxidoreductase subunit NuoN [Actinomycetota bacterium]